jgi:hypothetical protein
MILLLVGLSSAATPTQAAAPDASNPRTVTDEFYSWYIQYGRTHPVAGHPFITRDLAQRIDASQGAGIDPALCAQNNPHGISTDPAHITGDTASVTVRLHFGGSERHIIARVIRDPAADIWSIDDLAMTQQRCHQLQQSYRVKMAVFVTYKSK